MTIKNQCEKHPTNIYQLNLCNGKYLLCMDCIAEFAVKQGVTDVASVEQKELAQKKELQIIEEMKTKLAETVKPKAAAAAGESK